MKKVQTPLFQGITENEWNEMQNCSCMRQQSFEKNELIFRMGESVREIGIVLTGSVNIENVDLWGNKSLLSNISAGQVFAETYAFCQEPLMVNAVAAEYTNLLFLNLETLMQPAIKILSGRTRSCRISFEFPFTKISSCPTGFSAQPQRPFGDVC